MFYLSVALGFIYSGLCFFTVKTFEAQYASLIDGYEILVVTLTVIFLLLTILSGSKLNELRKSAESNPIKMYDMMFHIVYMTFLYATMYLLLNGAVMIALPSVLSSVLLLKTWIISLPVALIYLAIMIKKNKKKNLVKSLVLHFIIAIVLIANLAVVDILIFGLMFFINKIKTSKSISKAFDVLDLVALTVTFGTLFFLLANNSWILVGATSVLVLIMLLIESSNIKTYFKIFKNKIGGTKYEA